MITVQLNGGLGNQLFQYSAAKSLSFYHNEPLRLDISSYKRSDLPDLEVPRDFELHNFVGIQDEIIVLSADENEDIIKFLKKKSFSKLLPNHKRKIYSEPHYHFDRNFFSSRKDVLLRGQWQSEKYFVRYKDYFLENLQLKPELTKNIQDKANKIRSCNSVSVHIRRSDYLRKKVILEWHGVMTEQYYLKAFQLLEDKIGSFKPFYFTDDPQWVKEELMSFRDGELVSGHQTHNHYEDFYLISQCKHNIIANSSFSWWGAWLNRNPNKIVIGPQKWFNKGPKDTYDIIPENWEKL